VRENFAERERQYWLDVSRTILVGALLGWRQGYWSVAGWFRRCAIWNKEQKPFQKGGWMCAFLCKAARNPVGGKGIQPDG